MRDNLVVAVRGTGVAAACGQALLGAAGVEVQREVTDRPRVPAVMLSLATQALLADIFQRPALFDGLWRIERRIVAWGSQPVADLPHSAIVVSERELLHRLENRLEPGNGLPVEPGLPSWTIHTNRLAEGEVTHDFGTRVATATHVRLSAKADARACLMESLEFGWLFLLPENGQTAWLLSAGGPAETLLGESRLVRLSVGEPIATGRSFPAHPRIVDPLSGVDWLACGSAALGFDPLCGDGTGHAVREALLACAVIRASESSALGEALMWEYRLRLWAGFGRHLELCRQFYSTGGQGEWWQLQRDGLNRGLRWLSARNSPCELGRFRLNGFNLEYVPDRLPFPK